jgi:NADP-dependent 3-hydroxy acid dehydrogenase YdfG
MGEVVVITGASSSTSARTASLPKTDHVRP